MFQCFVVCPFGVENDEGDEGRLFEELKGLRQHVFTSAEARCAAEGYPVRIVDAREAGHDNPQILTSTQIGIDDADAILVVLTRADKPNVFLELAWAQGMWHKPILLKRDGFPPPSDISNNHWIAYTSKQAAGTEPCVTVVDGLAKAIINRIKLGRVEKPFEHWPTTTLARGSVHVYNRFSKAVSLGEWSKMIRDAKREIIIASTRMSRITGQVFDGPDKDGETREMGLREFLFLKALDGVKVTILMYHEDNLTLGHLKKLQENHKGQQDDLRESFVAWSTQRLAYENAARLGGAESGGFRVIQLRNRHLPFRVTLTEQRALLTLRFYTEVFNSGLCIDALRPAEDIDPKKENMPVYTQIRKELEFLIAQNETHSEARYQEWAESRRQA